MNEELKSELYWLQTIHIPKTRMKKGTRLHRLKEIWKEAMVFAESNGHFKSEKEENLAREIIHLKIIEAGYTEEEYRKVSSPMVKRNLYKLFKQRYGY